MEGEREREEIYSCKTYRISCHRHSDVILVDYKCWLPCVLSKLSAQLYRERVCVCERERGRERERERERERKRERERERWGGQ